MDTIKDIWFDANRIYMKNGWWRNFQPSLRGIPFAEGCK